MEAGLGKFLRGAPLVDRIAFRTENGSGGCVLWTGPLDEKGYGHLVLNGRNIRVHQASYIAYIGEVPPGLEIDHLCRVRHCVNPDHLEAVTHRENILRGEGPSAQHARKTQCLRGHEFDAVTRDGRRQCNTCRREKYQAAKGRL
jgi:hypothetical protein